MTILRLYICQTTSVLCWKLKKSFGSNVTYPTLHTQTHTHTHKLHSPDVVAVWNFVNIELKNYIELFTHHNLHFVSNFMGHHLFICSKCIQNADLKYNIRDFYPKIFDHKISILIFYRNGKDSGRFFLLFHLFLLFILSIYSSRRKTVILVMAGSGNRKWWMGHFCHFIWSSLSLALNINANKCHKQTI